MVDLCQASGSPLELQFAMFGCGPDIVHVCEPESGNDEALSTTVGSDVGDQCEEETDEGVLAERLSLQCLSVKLDRGRQRDEGFNARNVAL